MGLDRTWVAVALLTAPIATAFAQNGASTDAVLRPGDALRITVWNHPELSGDFAVAPDSALVSHSISPLTTNEKIPSVTMMSGNVRILATGLMNAFTNPNTTATPRKGIHPPT